MDSPHALASLILASGSDGKLHVTLKGVPESTYCQQTTGVRPADPHEGLEWCPLCHEAYFERPLVIAR